MHDTELYQMLWKISLFNNDLNISCAKCSIEFESVHHDAMARSLACKYWSTLFVMPRCEIYFA